MRRAKILSTGSFAPDKVLTNFDLERMVETSDKWIIERTGIRERRIVDDENMCTSDLAKFASEEALLEAGISPKDIDLIIVATVSPDMLFPATACRLQAKLGAKKAFAFDINAGCSGFVYALSVADQFIKSGKCNYVLCVGAEILSRVTDYQDRSTCVLLGDGAGAVVLGPTEDENEGVISFYLHSDGVPGKFLYMPAGGSCMPATHDTVDKRLHFTKMEGQKLYKIAVRVLVDVALEALEENGFTVDDISYLIPHQANLRIIEYLAKTLGISMDKVIVNIDRYGNTSAASIPIAMDEANKDGRLKKGDLILLDAFGAGLTWASMLMRW